MTRFWQRITLFTCELKLWTKNRSLWVEFAKKNSQCNGIIIMKRLLQLGQELNHQDHWRIQGGQSGIGNLAGSAILVVLTSFFVDNGQRAECRSGGRAVKGGRWVVRGACCANTESWRKNGKQNRLYDLSLLFQFSHIEGQCNKTVFAMLLMLNIVGKLYNKV